MWSFSIQAYVPKIPSVIIHILPSPFQNKKTAEAISIDFMYSHAIIDIEKGRAANTPYVEPLKRR